MEKHRGIIKLNEVVSKHFDPNRIEGYCKDCPNYGKLWSCPPFDFDVRIAFEGRENLIVNAWAFETYNLSDDAIERINMETVYEMNYLILEEEKKEKGSFAFYADSCVICGENSCTRSQNKPCRHIDIMRYPLEAFGIDVNTLLNDLFGLKLIWAEQGKKYPDIIIRVTGLIK